MVESQAEPLKVLLVDDEAYFRVFVGKVLRKSVNCTVSETKNGKEAVAYCKTNNPDLIILDISMPHMDGVEALAAIRAIKPDTPVIMLTSIAEEKVVEECVKQNASYFIRKDVGADKLQIELQEMLRMFAGGKESS
jgi:two-component system chemotaxis response regulator CheY